MRDSPVNRLEPHWPPAAPYDVAATERWSWSDSARSWEGNLEVFMADHPKVALIAAAAAGLVLGWMVKRK